MVVQSLLRPRNKYYSVHLEDKFYYQYVTKFSNVNGGHHKSLVKCITWSKILSLPLVFTYCTEMEVKTKKYSVACGKGRGVSCYPLTQINTV